MVALEVALPAVIIGHIMAVLYLLHTLILSRRGSKVTGEAKVCLVQVALHACQQQYYGGQQSLQ